MEDIKILRIKEVAEVTGLKPSTIYKLIRQKSFPKGINLTSRSTGWPSYSVNQWLKNKLEGTA
jgi:prophage regulatory protein